MRVRTFSKGRYQYTQKMQVGYDPSHVSSAKSKWMMFVKWIQTDTILQVRNYHMVKSCEIQDVTPDDAFISKINAFPC